MNHEHLHKREMDFGMSSSSSSTPPTKRKPLSYMHHYEESGDEKKEDWRTTTMKTTTSIDTATTTIPSMPTSTHGGAIPHRRYPHSSSSPPEYGTTTHGGVGDVGGGGGRPSLWKSPGGNGIVGISTSGSGSSSACSSPNQTQLHPRRIFPSGNSHPSRNRCCCTAQPSTKIQCLFGTILTIAIVGSLTFQYFLALGVVLETDDSHNYPATSSSISTTIHSPLRDNDKNKNKKGPMMFIDPHGLHERRRPRIATWNLVDDVKEPSSYSFLRSWRGNNVLIPSGTMNFDEPEDEGIEGDILSQVPPKETITKQDTSDTAAAGVSSAEGDIPEDKTDVSSSGLEEECVAAEPWQEESHPNCNSVHELVLLPRGQFLGQGWFRMTWLYDDVVVKMLRLEREYLEEYYELHRRDAVAMDHLTFSPYVMNVYGYCGQSAINELADFKPEINSLEQVDRRLRGQHTNGVLLLKLRLALSVSLGLYHVHYGIPGNPWEHGDKELTIRPSMAHYDINPRNIAIIHDGSPKLNDFNIAEFLRYPRHDEKGKTCGFPSRLHEPWWRAPEEMNLNSTKTIVDEKVDIYALGSVLFHILTTHAPRGKMQKERMDGVRKDVINGIRPNLMEPFASDPSPIVQAFREAMALCFHDDPRKRGTSGAVATIFHEALEEISRIRAEHENESDVHDKVMKEKAKKKRHRRRG